MAKHWRNEHHGKEDCAKFFVDRGGGLVSSGVEGGYSADGVMACLMFMMRAESPRDLAVLLLHLKVRGSCGDGETDLYVLRRHRDELLEPTSGENMIMV